MNEYQFRRLVECVENKYDDSPECISLLKMAYHETGDVEFLREAQRRELNALFKYMILFG